MDDSFLARCAVTAYKKDLTHVDGKLISYRFDFGRTDSQLFMLLDRGDLVIAFRGSDSIKDWLFNLFVAQTSTPNLPKGAKVHKGFYTAFMDVADQVKQKITTLTPKRIFLTGHSLGGGVALVSAAEIAAYTSVPIIVRTFGAPMAGNRVFAKYLNNNFGVIQYGFGGDPVIRLPLIKSRWSHVWLWHREPERKLNVCDHHIWIYGGLEYDSQTTQAATAD